MRVTLEDRLILEKALCILFERLIRQKKYDEAVPVYLLAKRSASDRPGRPDDGWNLAYRLKTNPREHRAQVKGWIRQLEQQIKEPEAQEA